MIHSLPNRPISGFIHCILNPVKSFFTFTTLIKFIFFLFLFSGIGSLLFAQTSPLALYGSGTFKVPVGVTVIKVECWGGGGAGGGQQEDKILGGGGGAGGAYASIVMAVTAGTVYNYTVAGTKTGNTSGNALNGNPSWFSTTSTVYAEGGAGGTLPKPGIAVGGIGSSASSYGDIKYAGVNGATGTATLGGAGGGGAGSTGIGGSASGITAGTGTNNSGGSGGAGKTVEGDGIAGLNYGGGGGGAFIPNDNNHPGGSGSAGQIVISWGGNYFRSKASGDWNAVGTWQVSPDNVTWINATYVPTNAALGIQIMSGHSVTVSTAVTASSLIVDGSLSITGSNTLTPVNATINGTVTVQNRASFINGSGPITFNSNSTYTHNEDGGTIPTATWNILSTCLITGFTNTLPSGFGQSFGNLTWNCTGQNLFKYMPDGNITVNGNFTLSAGTFNLSDGSLLRTLTIKGNYIQNNTGIFDFASGTGTISSKVYLAGNLIHTTGSQTLHGTGTAYNGEINFNGTLTQTVSFTHSDGSVWTRFIVNSGSTVQLLSNITLYGSNSANNYGEIIVNGTIDVGNYVINQGGTTSGGTRFTLNSGATLVISNSTGINGTLPDANTSKIFNTGANYNYNGTTAQVTGSLFTSANNLTINNSAGVTLSSTASVSGTTLITPSTSRLIIPPATCLTTTSITSTTNPNQLLIQTSPTGTGGNGSLIFFNTDPVQATVEMYSKAACTNKDTKTGYKWQFFGIPLLSMNSANPTLYGAYVRKMNEDIDPHWQQLTNESSLSAFTGYEITQLDPATYTFQGQLINGDHTINLTYTSGKQYAGQNLIGNPYTAAIDISKLIYTGNVYNTVYIYNTGSYDDWVKAGNGTKSDSTDKNITAGQYTAVPKNLAGSASLPNQIPSMQAFLVKASTSTASLTIPYNSVVGTLVANSVPQRSKGMHTKSSSDKIWTVIDVKGSRFSDRMWIFTEPVCTHSFDNGWDGEKIIGSGLAPQLYAMEADGDYQVNSVDDINNTYLGFQAGEDSLYTLTFTHQNLVLKYGNVYLVDSVAQQTVDITSDSTKYTFLSLPTDTIVRRFKIITNPDITTNVTTPALASTQLNVFSSNHSVYIDNKSDEKGSLYLYDMTGRIIQKYDFTAQGITTFQTNVSPGTYLVKGITKSRTVTKNISL